MAILGANKLYTTRGGTHALGNRFAFREMWEVRSDSIEDDEDTAGAAPGIPRLGQPHPKFPTAICVEVAADQSEDTPFIWYVAVKFDSQLDLANSTDPNGDAQSPADIPENPLLRPAVWRTSCVSTTEAATHWRQLDANFNLAAVFTPIRNSAKLPFDPPLTIEVTRPVIRVTKNVKKFDLPAQMRLENAVNDRLWFNVPKWCARVCNVEANSKFENGVAFVEVTFDVMLKRETWLAQLLDCGFYTLDQRTQENGQQKQTWTKIRDPFGHEATDPQPLDGNGKKLAPTADPVFLRGLPSNYHLENFTLLLAGV